jgi:hypothetical protein
MPKGEGHGYLPIAGKIKGNIELLNCPGECMKEIINITPEQIEEARLKAISGQEAFFLNAEQVEKAAIVDGWGNVRALPGYEIAQSEWSIIHQKWGMSYWSVKNNQKTIPVKLEPEVIAAVVSAVDESVKEQVITEEPTQPTKKKSSKKEKSI